MIPPINVSRLVSTQETFTEASHMHTLIHSILRLSSPYFINQHTIARVTREVSMDHDSVYNDSDWLCSSADLIGFENDYTWYGDAAKESYPSLPFGLDSSMMPASSAMYIDEMSEVSPSMSQDLQSMPNSSNAARFHASVYLPSKPIQL